MDSSRNDLACLFSQAGYASTLEHAGRWLATLPESEREAMFATEPELREDYIEPYGDRQNELVLIGQWMDREAVEQSLDACLWVDEKMVAAWDSFHDPLRPTPGTDQFVTYSD